MAVPMPPGVPVFHVDGHSTALDDQYAHISYGLGHRRSRRTRTASERIITIKWLLTSEQLRAVIDWYEYDLQAGALEFTCQVKDLSSSGLETIDARWLSFSVQMMHLGRGMVTGSMMVLAVTTGAPSNTGVPWNSGNELAATGLPFDLNPSVTFLDSDYTAQISFIIV
jgi:hypothetical protein